MEKKQQLEEMISNLNRTINKMGDRKKVQSQSNIFESATADKSKLIRTRAKILNLLKGL
tara:strand:+ start:139 stop:315 length:177 start_codon:yes stop_codon:yes gene_type:complete